MQNFLRVIKRETKEIGNQRLAYLWALTFGHLVVHWYMNLLSLSLPFIHEDLDLSEFQLSLLTTVQIGAASCLFIVSGFLADSFRQRGAMIVASAIISFGIAFFNKKGTATKKGRHKNYHLVYGKKSFRIWNRLYGCI